uniref:uncharacterized protein LOC118146164 n=1 Tax=Callithrix jacchus TaxID=9483 RepID=UPI0023DD4F8D|nr:uncharacterized protein LOC118146164 [Callithrix jacchus]
MWGTSARAAGPGGTHRAWAPGRRRPVRGPLAGSPPLATRAPLQPRRGGGTDSCVAALEGRGRLRPRTGGRTRRYGSCRGRGGSRVRTRSPLQVPSPPRAASAAPASPTPRLRSALCMSSLPGRGRADLRVRSRPPCGYAARTWPLGSPRLRTALRQRLCPAGGARRRYRASGAAASPGNDCARAFPKSEKLSHREIGLWRFFHFPLRTVLPWALVTRGTEGSASSPLARRWGATEGEAVVRNLLEFSRRDQRPVYRRRRRVPDERSRPRLRGEGGLAGP